MSTATAPGKRRRRTPSERKAMQDEALSRATGNVSLANWPAIILGFVDKGIPESEIHPRQNIFTYAAWRALKRQVRKGEKGVRVHTWIPTSKDEKQTDGTVKTVEKKFCKAATVFHVTQTDPVA